MPGMNPETRRILSEFDRLQENYDQHKLMLRDVLNKYGMASTEFNTARVDFEALKEELEEFRKKNHSILFENKR